MGQQQVFPALFDLCQPCEDVLSGEPGEDQLAANLALVAFDSDDTAPVYRDADSRYVERQSASNRRWPDCLHGLL